MSSLTIGFVYVLVNSAMPGLVKVGMSSRLAEDRAKELGTTGVPEPFEVVYRAATSFPLKVEKRAHSILADNRTNASREFFRVSPNEAISAVREACLQMAGIEARFTEFPRSTTRLRADDRVALTLRAGQFLFVLPCQGNSLSLGAALRGENETPFLDVWQAHSDGDLLELMATEVPERVSGFSQLDEGGYSDPIPYLTRNETVANGSLIGKERLLPGERLLWVEDSSESSQIKFHLFECKAFCQITCRTWNPQSTPEGWPLIFNYLTNEKLSSALIELVHKKSEVRSIEIEPSFSCNSNKEIDFGSVPDEPEYWLMQLAKARKRKNP